MRALFVLIPPLTQRGHVVTGYGTYRPERISAQVTETSPWVFRHTLYFQTENLQVFHHPWHAVGYHTEVFRTNQHAGSLYQLGQLAHGFPIPELVVATIEIVVIQLVECVFVYVVKTLVDIIELCGDTWMEKFWVLAVTQEEYVTNQCVESVSQPYFFFLVGVGEVCLHFSLGIDVLPHAITFVVDGNQETFFYFLGSFVEDILEYPIINKRSSKAFFLEIESVTSDFLTGHTQGGRELSEESVYTVSRYFPDTEESQYVVDAIGIEVLLHVLEATYPPSAVVLYHFFPVVGGEAPVLSIYGEVIGWCSRLTVKIEVFGFHPYVTSMAVDTDGDISFQYDTQLSCMLMGIQ